MDENSQSDLGDDPSQNVPAARPLTLSVSAYALNVHDIESDTVVPMTTPRLIEMTKLVDTLADEGVVNALFQILSQDLNRFYGWPPSPALNNIHVMAKRPDGQSAAERAAIMALGASLGARHFSGAGTLSLDEVFSPEQLMLDCEIRDWVARWVRGISIAEDQGDDWLEEIREGIQQGFMALDSTLDYYREQTWYPARFERRAIGPWLEEDQPHLATRLRVEVRERIAGHAYRLDETRWNALDAIYAAAERATSRS